MSRFRLILASLLVFGCAVPDFEREATPAGPAEAKVPLPIFAVPAIDARQGNSILALFIDTTAGKWVELTLVCADEDIQTPILDPLYDLLRWRDWHRIADLESFRFQYADYGAEPAPRPATVSFPSTYSGAQTWDVLAAAHHGADIPARKFVWMDGRPVIFINTWNHLLSNRNNNPDLDLEYIADYPVYRGSRSDVQSLYEVVYSDS